MKIAIINKVISQSGGGAERYAADFITTAVGLGHQIDAYGNHIEDVPDSVNSYHIPMKRKPGWRKILSFNRNAKIEVDKRRNEYDIVYAMTQAFPADLYFMGGGAHKRWLEIRFPNALQRTLRCLLNPTHYAQMWLEDQIFNANNVSMILANSHLIKKHAMHYGNVAPERVAVVHNGIDESVFNLKTRDKFRAESREELGLAENDIGLLFLSHNWPRKGLDTIIKALGRDGMGEKAQRYKLFVAGKGKPEMFQKLAQECGATIERINFLGSVTQPQKLYAAGDVFVLPTMYDPCAGVTVEAMAMGLPVITSTDNGAHELLRHSETGYVLQSPHDYKSLAQHLTELLNDEKRQIMGLAAAKEIAPRTFTQVVKETLAVMQQIVDSRK